MFTRFPAQTAIFFLFASIAFAQPNLSPALRGKELSIVPGKTRLSVSVRNAREFTVTYHNKILVHHQSAISGTFVITTLNHTVLLELKQDPNVLFIDHHRVARQESTLDYTNSSFNRITKTWRQYPSLKGSGHNVSIKELNIDAANIDIRNRTFVTPLSPAKLDQHATTMAIILSGGGNSSHRAKGVASEAHITASDFSNLFPDDPLILAANNINVQNHSYGVGIENYYGNEAFAYDQQVAQNPKLVHVFSAGNLGTTKPASGTYQNLDFANLSGNFKQAKNVLVVNAVDSTLTANALNSRGPTFDGRVKPELTAYGQGGTSDAAALVSGITTLIQEHFEVLQSGLPDASMVKAILIASADDIGLPGIDFTYGYGSVNAYKALRLLDLGQWNSTIISSNDQVTIPIAIPASVSELKIAIAWTDPPASPNAASVIQNDIDSRLVYGSDDIYPWVLSAYPHKDSLLSTPKQKADHRNTVEYITLNNPTAGSYSLILNSGPLTTAAQVVSVAYWMDTSTPFIWDFPTTTDVIEGGIPNRLFWEATPGQTGNLYLQLNMGSWQLVASDLPLDQNYVWNSPDTLAQARLKMTIGTNDFISEEFLVSPLGKLNIAFLCPDSLGFSWQARSPATGYRLYAMGSQYLEPALLTTDTLVVMAPTAQVYFAVAPIFNGIEGLKSRTIDYTLQGTSCFLNTFFAQRFNSTEVRLQLQLSSTYAVQAITLYKTVKGVKRVFASSTIVDRLLFNFTDDELIPGFMTYQAEITLSNGKTILSDSIGIPIEENGKAILYPNPISDQSDLNILSAGDGKMFRILDAWGRLVYEAEINTTETSLDIVNLPTGMYFYQLLSADGVTDSGRFIKY